MSWLGLRNLLPRLSPSASRRARRIFGTASSPARYSAGARKPTCWVIVEWTRRPSGRQPRLVDAEASALRLHRRRERPVRAAPVLELEVLAFLYFIDVHDVRRSGAHGGGGYGTAPPASPRRRQNTQPLLVHSQERLVARPAVTPTRRRGRRGCCRSFRRRLASCARARAERRRRARCRPSRRGRRARWRPCLCSTRRPRRS